jgi:hypothetical protein
MTKTTSILSFIAGLAIFSGAIAIITSESHVGVPQSKTYVLDEVKVEGNVPAPATSWNYAKPVSGKAKRTITNHPRSSHNDLLVTVKYSQPLSTGGNVRAVEYL